VAHYGVRNARDFTKRAVDGFSGAVEEGTVREEFIAP
jgi:hypothetical protein